jgi:phosphatidate cytidylyltransferase
MAAAPPAPPPDPAADPTAAPAQPAAPPKKKSDLGPRLVTAVVMVPIMLWLIFAAHWFWAAFILLAVTFGLHESNAMLLKAEAPTVRHAVTAIGVAFFSVCYLCVGERAPLPLRFSDGGAFALMLLSCVVWAVMLFHLLRPRDIPRVAQAISGSLAGVLYVAVGFTFVALLRRDLPDGGSWVLLMLALCWMSDTGAYFAGRAFGKRKLAPLVSPAKSVEGAAGGLLGSIAAGFLFGPVLGPSLAAWQVLLLALPANFLAQAGDLCESMLKRSVQVKDSGTIIHGHGGMLDRVDAVIFVAPYVYIFARLVVGL